MSLGYKRPGAIHCLCTYLSGLHGFSSLKSLNENEKETTTKQKQKKNIRKQRRRKKKKKKEEGNAKTA